MGNNKQVALTQNTRLHANVNMAPARRPYQREGGGHSTKHHSTNQPTDQPTTRKARYYAMQLVNTRENET